MTDPINPFRPKSDSKPPETREEWLAELERLESLLEEMREQGLAVPGDLERQMNEIEAMLEANTDGPEG